MSGEWFDLNGKITQVYALVDEARTSEASHQTYAPRKISDIALSSKNFMSKMGKIDFDRI